MVQQKNKAKVIQAIMESKVEHELVPISVSKGSNKRKSKDVGDKKESKVKTKKKKENQKEGVAEKEDNQEEELNQHDSELPKDLNQNHNEVEKEMVQKDDLQEKTIQGGDNIMKDRLTAINTLDKESKSDNYYLDFTNIANEKDDIEALKKKFALADQEPIEVHYKKKLNKINTVKFKKNKLNLTKPLLVLDMIGIFCYKKRKSLSCPRYTYRNGIKKFLSYCFSNFNVVLWSTMHPKNIHTLANQVFGDYIDDIICILSYKQSILKGRSNEKAESYKNLYIVWNIIKAHSGIDQFNCKNTLIIDSSNFKVKSHLNNQIQLIEFEKNMHNDQELVKLKGYLESLLSKRNSETDFDFSKYIPKNPFKDFILAPDLNIKIYK